MRIAMLLARHPPRRKSPIMPEVVRLLRSWGADVDVRYPDEETTVLDDMVADHDLYVLKSGSETALSVAGGLHACGAAILNPYPVAAACRDKIVTHAILAAAGVPVPEAFVTGQASSLAPALADGPLVVKPHRGSQGRGVRVMRRPSELSALAGVPGPIFAQRRHPPDGRDHKLYCIGDHVFGVRRVWPPRTYEEKLGTPFTVSHELREIAVAAGRAFGIDLYGLDVILSGGRPVVVDFSSFPGFKGVPDAALRLADHVYAVARQVASGGGLPLDVERTSS
jgi:ribosomal protein S6--L-glutamate ligase